MRSLTTPAYVLNNEILEKSINDINDSLFNNFKHSILSYSLKTNSLPYILNKVMEKNGYAEVVSKDEYELARLVGFDISKIVYNGPLKSKETFLEAIMGGAIVNIETKNEIEWLRELPRGKIFNIGIRVNIDLAVISPEDSKLDEDYSRFGFSVESGEFKEAIDKINTYKNIKLSGLHAHRTTLTRSIFAYSKICEYIGKIAKEYHLDLDYIDIGGGYYGIMENKPTFNEYFSSIAQKLELYFDLDKTTIIIEPGNAIVASCLDFITSVIDVKKIRDFHVVTIDGSRNDIDPFYKKNNYSYSLLLSNDTIKSCVNTQIIAGGTCLEYDKLFKIDNQKLLSVGDKITFRSVGAYTMTLSPLFIRFFPSVYLIKDGRYSLIRKSWEAKDFFDIYDTKNL
ncbi:diaminopimelate decarboxylase [Acinetobacter lwoffii]|uniref:diaminopimelate decarboxylase n=1 Tax=Acinetobacter lwoffii TaxID=28090 RepID=UPI0021CD57B2|nr:diaminopimelate decarboxylase [Acinetobacter lwoffii]MCU4449604.1 diaminopimelate decarboxylase [Acinetobacter lwoffii]